MPTYPEHEKMQAVVEQSQSIGEFLDWLLNEKSIVLSQYLNPDSERLTPINPNTQDLLAEYFDIDLDKIEKEKRQMLKAMREANKEAQ